MKKLFSGWSLFKPFFIVFIVGVVALLLTSRLYSLQNSPPGFFVDESSIGYNAWTILHTAKDEHGTYFPLYFKAFGDYKNPLFIYSVSLVFAFFGASIETVRLTSAFWGLAAIGIVVLLLRFAKVTVNARIVILLLITSNPWFFQLSRVAFEVASTPFFLLVAILAYYNLCVKGTQKLQLAWLVIFSLSLAFMFYSYTSARILAPVLLMSGLFFLYRKIHIKRVVLTTILFLLCMLPAVIWEFSNPGALLARYQVVGLSHYTDSTQEFLFQASQNYIAHFSPQFLFFGGDENLRHIPAPFGILLVSSLPFVAAGLYSLLVRKPGNFSYWILLGLLISPIPSALTIQSPHVLRSIGILPFLFVCFWYGVEYLRTTKRARPFFFIATGVLVIESLLFLTLYFSQYTQHASIWFDDATVQLVENGVSYPGPYYVSTQLYPGTEATVQFSAAVRRSQNMYGEPTVHTFDPQTSLLLENGTFFLDGDACKRLSDQNSDTSFIVFSHGGNCIVHR